MQFLRRTKFAWNVNMHKIKELISATFRSFPLVAVQILKIPASRKKNYALVNYVLYIA